MGVSSGALRPVAAAVPIPAGAGVVQTAVAATAALENGNEEAVYETAPFEHNGPGRLAPNPAHILAQHLARGRYPLTVPERASQMR
ncbi:hypothetical protein QBC99_005173 [Beijerinckia sp. GAS462]|nr:hypothetical protein [Beijerinckia sp. GAS462]SED96148.1 hypothetical protein SAMN05443249_6051 [Beijerinckia sp. 28-YEA-48]